MIITLNFMRINDAFNVDMDKDMSIYKIFKNICVQLYFLAYLIGMMVIGILFRLRMRVIDEDNEVYIKFRWLPYKQADSLFFSTVKLIYIERNDGPALIHYDGTKEWYQNNIRHRADGPAITYAGDAEPHWFYHGENFTMKEFLELPHVTEELKTLLILEYG